MTCRLHVLEASVKSVRMQMNVCNDAAEVVAAAATEAEWITGDDEDDDNDEDEDKDNDVIVFVLVFILLAFIDCSK